MTHVFIDIDGVINAVSVDPPTNTGWDPDLWNQERVNGYMITWNTELVDTLNDIFKNSDVTPVFLTTWQAQAKHDLAPVIGLEAENYKVLHPDNQNELFSIHNGWWKLHALKNEIEASDIDRLVWLDDDIKYEANATDWANARSLSGNTLALSPHTGSGLTKNDLHAIIKFVNQ